MKKTFYVPIGHLIRMTTDHGMMQHSKFAHPLKEFGYSIDDNARALIICLEFHKRNRCVIFQQLAQKYANYILKAQIVNGLFHNFMDFKGNFLDERGSNDSFGRSVWALGYLVSRGLEGVARNHAIRSLEAAAQNFRLMRHVRSKSFILCGLSEIAETRTMKWISDDLLDFFEKNHRSNWEWFEDKLTYSNAILPYALLKSYTVLKSKDLLRVGLITLDFLFKVSCHEGFPAPIGQEKWYYCNQEKGIFDQQLIDGADMVMAAVTAYQITKEEKYKRMADIWFRWFHGGNIHRIELIDYHTEGCYDAITKKGVNLNQGAESILAYLLALHSYNQI